MVALVRGFEGGKKVIPLASPPPPGPPPPPDLTTIPEFTKPPEGTKPLEIPKPSGPTPAPSAELAARIRAGSVIFNQFCIVCHGPDGTGRVVRANIPAIPDFTNKPWQLTKKDGELQVSILEGKGTLMPANNIRVTRDQARDLVAFVRSFAGLKPSEGPMTDSAFDKAFKQLQQQYDELEKELKKGSKG
jgi:mono/diheme cytochrome c family protein